MNNIKRLENHFKNTEIRSVSDIDMEPSIKLDQNNIFSKKIWNKNVVKKNDKPRNVNVNINLN